MKLFTRLVRTASLLFGLTMCTASIGAQGVGEFQVKALFIYNFAKFVEWPSEAFASPHDPINICIAGPDPFGADIDQELKGKTVSSRELTVRRIPKGDDVKGCQVVYSAFSDQRRAKQLLGSLGNTPVLSIGEADTFSQSGVVIGFVLDGSKVRFDINLEAAERAHLKISSKLLSLAMAVKEQGK